MASGDDALLRTLPWVPGPDAIALSHHGAATVRGGAWAHWLTPALFVLAWIVTIASFASSSLPVDALPYPLAAIGACCAALPAALAFRHRAVDVGSAQALYRALWWLSPWLVLAWPLSCRLDSDGGSGGSHGGSIVLVSSFVMLPVLPLTIELARASLALGPWVRRATTVVFRASLVVIAAALVVSAWRVVTHPTEEGLRAYHRTVAAFEPSGSEPGLFIAHTLERRLEQRRDGDRCVTGFPGRRGIPHACAELVLVYERLRRFVPREGRPIVAPPRYFELTFVAVGGAVVASEGSPRHLLFVAPPWEWVAGGAVALTLALWTRRRTRRALAAWRALPVMAGVARDGHAHCDDGTIVRLPSDFVDHQGAVVVLGERGLGGPAFRDVAAGEATVLPCTAAGWERSLAECQATAASFGLAVLWLPSAPLMAAPFLGMFS